MSPTDGPLQTRAEALIADLGAHMAGQITVLTTTLHEHMATRIAPLQGDEQLLRLLEASIESNIESLVHLLRYDIPVAESHAPAAAREYARRLAQRGIGVAALIRAYRLGQELVTSWAFAQLDAMEDDTAVTLLAGRLFSELTFRFIDAVSEQVVEEYETERARRQAQRNTMRVAMVDELVAGRPVDVSAAEQALGHRLRQHHVAAVVWAEADATDANPVANLEHAVDVLTKALGVTQTPLFLPRERTLGWAWIPVGRGDGTADLGVTVLPAGVRVALGRAASGAEGFRTSHVEAQRAVRLAAAAGTHASTITAYGEADVRTAALLAQDLESTRHLVARTLGGLALDSDGAARLRETLRAFLAHRGSFLATGEHLHLHKNTVKYRIDKAVEEIGHPLEDDRLELEMALVAAAQLGPVVLQS
ncbi:CdaR family transcriptional regulator [Aeromicrobium sp. Leaf350]|uniref:PucR family transcriptional regulator n=1 Tax=Aeromicrobium sp. Leaf350 TaxID=2876565 RepID=UPI001E2B8020|nr:helix-turn-helix domain-containing protein [Aeromicrobium sp. Leaf350]